MGIGDMDPSGFMLGFASSPQPTALRRFHDHRNHPPGHRRPRNPLRPPAAAVAQASRLLGQPCRMGKGAFGHICCRREAIRRRAHHGYFRTRAEGNRRPVLPRQRLDEYYFSRSQALLGNAGGGSSASRIGSRASGVRVPKQSLGTRNLPLPDGSGNISTW